MNRTLAVLMDPIAAIHPEKDSTLAMLLEARLEEGPLGEEEAYRRLDAWYAKVG